VIGCLLHGFRLRHIYVESLDAEILDRRDGLAFDRGLSHRLEVQVRHEHAGSTISAETDRAGPPDAAP
jgi:hypothetical protein